MMNGNWASAPFFKVTWIKLGYLCCFLLSTQVVYGEKPEPILLENTEYSIDTQTVNTLEPTINRSKTVEPKIDQENFEVILYAGLNSVEDFGVNPVAGIRGAYHITEDFFVEATYGVSDTEESSVEVVNQIELISDDDRRLSYYALNLGWHFLPGEGFILNNKTLTNQLYVVMGFGSTEFAGDSASTFNFGLGYRMLLNDVFAIRIDFRDYIFEYNLLGEEERTNNFETTVGFSTFF